MHVSNNRNSYCSLEYCYTKMLWCRHSILTLGYSPWRAAVMMTILKTSACSGWGLNHWPGHTTYKMCDSLQGSTNGQIYLPRHVPLLIQNGISRSMRTCLPLAINCLAFLWKRWASSELSLGYKELKCLVRVALHSRNLDFKVCCRKLSTESGIKIGRSFNSTVFNWNLKNK